MVDVQVNREKARPVEVTLHGHPHKYEIAWRTTDDGPVITDLRISSGKDAIPITTNSLRRLVVERLASAAQTYDTDQAASIGEFVKNDLEAALTDVMSSPDPAVRVAGYMEWLSKDSEGDEFQEALVAELRSLEFRDLSAYVDRLWADRGRSFVVSPAMVAGLNAEVEAERSKRKQRGGRPKDPRYSYDFLEKVARWALEGKDKLSVHQHVRERAIASGINEYDARPGHVRYWIGLCKEAGLLAPDALRKPRQRRPRKGG